jgi:diguanylate cyclase (GGDEF)-like protein
VGEEPKHRDSLTGLGNSSEAFSQLQRDLASGTAGAVIFCDLDYFRAFNEVNGHVQGDELLRLVATTLAPPREDATPHDAYRIGGEEFLIRVPGADLHTAKALAEEARRKIKQLPAAMHATPTGEKPLTARFAVAAWRAGQAPSETKLLAAAERVLAGQATRDAVVSVDDDGDDGGGGAGVREPRRPLPNAPSATDAVDPVA